MRAVPAARGDSQVRSVAKAIPLSTPNADHWQEFLDVLDHQSSALGWRAL
jgi:hypothetical protein